MVARQGDIEACARAVAVHGGEQYFTRTQRYHITGEGDGIKAGRVASAMGKNFPPTLTRCSCIDRHHDALGAEFTRGVGNELPIVDGRRINRDLVGAGQ